MKTIVTGFIDNPEGQQALDLAIEEAHRRQAQLIVVHSMKGRSHTSTQEVLRYRKALEEVEDRLAGEGIAFETHDFARGQTPAEDLISAATEYEADLIVIGYHKRTATGKALLGSHAHEILMRAKCPVLAIIAE